MELLQLYPILIISSKQKRKVAKYQVEMQDSFLEQQKYTNPTIIVFVASYQII